MTDATGVSSWAFNLLGQVTSLATPQGTFSYTYNQWGQPATMTDSSGVWTTLYDVHHRAVGMTNPWGCAFVNCGLERPLGLGVGGGLLSRAREDIIRAIRPLA
jgi:YD repeat-containing protein